MLPDYSNKTPAKSQKATEPLDLYVLTKQFMTFIGGICMIFWKDLTLLVNPTPTKSNNISW
jgi:hypothetical protein